MRGHYSRATPSAEADRITVEINKVRQDLLETVIELYKRTAHASVLLQYLQNRNIWIAVATLGILRLLLKRRGRNEQVIVLKSCKAIPIHP